MDDGGATNKNVKRKGNCNNNGESKIIEDLLDDNENASACENGWGVAIRCCGAMGRRSACLKIVMMGTLATASTTRCCQAQPKTFP